MHLAKCGTCGGAFVWMTRGPHVSVPIEKNWHFQLPHGDSNQVKGLASSADAKCSAEPICLSLRHLSRHRHTKKPCTEAVLHVWHKWSCEAATRTNVDICCY